jgi:hypothetical protein
MAMETFFERLIGPLECVRAGLAGAAMAVTPGGIE